MSPDHYKLGKIETIDIISEMGIGPEYCRGNLVKYATRLGKKDDELKEEEKILWYAARLIFETHGAQQVRAALKQLEFLDSAPEEDEPEPAESEKEGTVLKFQPGDEVSVVTNDHNGTRWSYFPEEDLGKAPGVVVRKAFLEGTYEVKIGDVYQNVYEDQLTHRLPRVWQQSQDIPDGTKFTDADGDAFYRDGDEFYWEADRFMEEQIPSHMVPNNAYPPYTEIL